jgi:hypothetical protein
VDDYSMDDDEYDSPELTSKGTDYPPPPQPPPPSSSSPLKKIKNDNNIKYKNICTQSLSTPSSYFPTSSPPSSSSSNALFFSSSQLNSKISSSPLLSTIQNNNGLSLNEDDLFDDDEDDIYKFVDNNDNKINGKEDALKQVRLELEEKNEEIERRKKEKENLERIVTEKKEENLKLRDEISDLEGIHWRYRGRPVGVQKTKYISNKKGEDSKEKSGYIIMKNDDLNKKLKDMINEKKKREEEEIMKVEKGKGGSGEGDLNKIEVQKLMNFLTHFTQGKQKE